MKWLGAFSLMLGAYSIGHTRVERLAHGRDLLFDLWLLVDSIGGQIAATELPLPQIYKIFAESPRFKTDFARRLAASGQFAACYESISAEITTTAQLDAPMRRFLQTLGKSETAAQVAICKETAEALHTELTKAENGFAAQKKMYLALSVCIGGMLVLFML